MSSVYQMSTTLLAANPRGAQVIDVRESAEVARGTIAGSRHIPLDELPVRVAELDRSRPIVTICQTGRRSQRAAELLAVVGFTVANLEGGMDRWVGEGRPTTVTSP